jgi:hypothetical protein
MWRIGVTGVVAVVGAGCVFDRSGLGAGGDDAPTIDAPTPPAIDAPDGDPGGPDAEPPAACPSGYLPSTSTHLPHRYRFVTTATNWAAAVADCADDGPPFTHLVVIDDAAEDTYVDLATDNRDVWIGASDLLEEGTWITVLGAPLAYDDFRAPEPNNGGNPEAVPGEDCAELRDGNGGWRDIACTQNRRYLCECAAP